MATGNDEVKCKRLLGMRHSKEGKRFKFSLRAVPAQSLVKKCNSKEKDVEKASVPGRNGSPESKTRSAADPIEDKAPPSQSTGTETSEQEHEDQEACAAPTSTSEPLSGFEDSDYRDLLKARVAELKRETNLLSRELQKHAHMCVELTDANRLLMDELKKMCEPCVIQILEAKNPNKNPQTGRDMESSETVS